MFCLVIALLCIVKPPSSVPLYFQVWDNITQGKANIRDKWVNKHCLNNFLSNNSIPLRHIIVKWSIDVLSDGIWPMFRHISVNKHNKQTRVEKLSNKHGIGNWNNQLTVGLISNLLKQPNNDASQNQVNSNNNEGNWLRKHLESILIVIELLTNWDLIVHFVSRNTHPFLVFTETLHCPREVLNLYILVYIVLVHCIVGPWAYITHCIGS